MQSAPDLTTLGLRDIHEPAAIGWWPLGPGWWVLLAALALALLFGAVRWHRRTRLGRMAARDLDTRLKGWLDHRDDQRLLADLSEWLRRVSIAVHGRAEVASLVGDAWRAFLDRGLSESPFSRLPGSLLIDAAYRKGVPSLDPDTVAHLERLCLRWAQSVAKVTPTRSTGASA
ncbi:MAG: DUF4381 domain-containing protein [Pseudomonadota bacterium]